VDARAFFGCLGRCRDRVKMERQAEHEQQYSRANEAPKLLPIFAAGNKHDVVVNE
jgi:hypothetical protein